ncbi:YkvI family membrane protein [Paenisporosarcina antarctica]|uniref:Transporter n=1 Tax=Paenisporosarcina antarctica TaxID=417367 RepID=A0A4P6ZZK2_9BACL|nr:hypothetical protein [Paenisporosarcina antarctica]QBP41922.1 hypothetical protein E2636_12515 [Paenisporosarcina antarctica]
MRKAFQIGAGFIGVIVGAGLASGQEILQFFTSFGALGIAGSVVATVLFAFLGMNLAQLGSRFQTTSHQNVIYYICGRYLGVVVDIIITFFLFGVTVVMFSGAGAIFEQQFGIPSFIGSILMTVLTIATVTLSVKKVITLISAITPFLLLLVIAMTVHSLINYDISSAALQSVDVAQNRGASHWLVAAILYVSYNIAAGAAMLTVMGGTVKDEKVAAWGGIIGGLGLGLIILLINISMLTQLKEIASVPMPMLFIANNMGPVMGGILSVILLAMIYNTAVGMLYAFSVRIVKPETVRFKGAVVVFGVAAFGASFVGFITLVGTVYPVMGYLGFTLIAAIIYAWIKKRGTSAKVGTLS